MTGLIDMAFVLATSACMVVALVRVLKMTGSLWGKDE